MKLNIPVGVELHVFAVGMTDWLFGYCISLGIRQVFFPFQSNPKNLDPSFKTDLDICDCFKRGNLISKQNFRRSMEKLRLITKEIW